MSNFLIFIHGGGEDGYQADGKLAASFRTELGEKYQVHYPKYQIDEK